VKEKLVKKERRQRNAPEIAAEKTMPSMNCGSGKRSVREKGWGQAGKATDRQDGNTRLSRGRSPSRFVPDGEVVGPDEEEEHHLQERGKLVRQSFGTRRQGQASAAACLDR
jgi:hypothetical protein